MDLVKTDPVQGINEGRYGGLGFIAHVGSKLSMSVEKNLLFLSSDEHFIGLIGILGVEPLDSLKVIFSYPLLSG